MRRIRALLLRVVGTFRGTAPDDDAREEMEAHLALHVAENVRRGMDPGAARREALVSAGGLTQAMELVRERRGLPWLQATAADLRHAGRTLRAHPAFTTVAVLTLALGVGANTAIFSVVNGVVLRPLPYHEPDRVVSVSSTMRGGPMDVSGPDFLDWRRQARAFSTMAAGYAGGEVVLTGSGEPERLSQARITSNTLDLLGRSPVLGRDFAEGEDEPSAPRVALLDEGLWRRRFGGDSSIIGRTLTFDGHLTTVIGIMPAMVRWPQAADVWLTTRFTERDLAEGARGARWITVLARLAPGATLAGARAEMDAIAAGLAQRDPAHNAGVGARVTPLQELIVGDLQRPLFLILGAVGFVLLIACANVASLTLGRVAARGPELAVRAALGASRGRLARQILTESLLLALLGGAAGVVLALAGMRALLAIAPADLPRLHDVRLDAAVLAFTFGLTLLSGVVFGLVPALQGAATGLHDRLRAAGRGAPGARGSGRTRRLLVVVQVALAVVLLAGAGLLLRSFARLRDVDAGFRPEQVTTFAVSLPSTRYAEAEQQRQFAGRLLDAMRRVPGVSDAASSFLLPLSGGGFGFTFEVRGRPPTPGPDEPRAQARVASASYFSAMGIPLLRGRGFDERDRPGTPPALVISRSVAQRYFADEDPIGKVLVTGWGSHGQRFGGEVVGIVGDVRQYALDGPVTAHMYMHDQQWPMDEFDVVVKGTATREAIAAGATAALRQLDPDVPLGQVRTLEEVVDASLGARRFYMTLLATFAAVALALAVVGVYGVIAYGVRVRRREIGVRLALGATRRAVVGMILADGMRLAVVGTAVGLTAAFVLTKLLTSLLFEVGTRDPTTFVVASGALTVAAVLACVIPARSAARLDPVETIRSE